RTSAHILVLASDGHARLRHKRKAAEPGLVAELRTSVRIRVALVASEIEREGIACGGHARDKPNQTDHGRRSVRNCLHAERRTGEKPGHEPDRAEVECPGWPASDNRCIDDPGSGTRRGRTRRVKTRARQVHAAW